MTSYHPDDFCWCLLKVVHQWVCPFNSDTSASACAHSFCLKHAFILQQPPPWKLYATQQLLITLPLQTQINLWDSASSAVRLPTGPESSKQMHTSQRDFLLNLSPYHKTILEKISNKRLFRFWSWMSCCSLKSKWLDGSARPEKEPWT